MAMFEEADAQPRDLDEAFLNLAKLIDDVQDPELRGRLINALDWYEHHRAETAGLFTQLMKQKDALHETLIAHHKKRGDEGDALKGRLKGALSRIQARWLGEEPEVDTGA
jgi:hypothetical protein